MEKTQSYLVIKKFFPNKTNKNKKKKHLPITVQPRPAVTPEIWDIAKIRSPTRRHAT